MSLSCGKQGILKNNGLTQTERLVNEGRVLNTSHCLESLQQAMEEVGGCENVEFAHTSAFDMIIQCYEPKKDSYWSRNVFRISNSAIRYNETDMNYVDAHTICKDDTWRIEVYPPMGDISEQLLKK